MPGLDRHHELNIWLDMLTTSGFETTKLSREDFDEIVQGRESFLSDRGITRPSIDPRRQVPVLGVSLEILLESARTLSDQDFDLYLDYVTAWISQYFVTLLDVAFMGDEQLIEQLVESELATRGFGPSTQWETTTTRKGS